MFVHELFVTLPVDEIDHVCDAEPDDIAGVQFDGDIPEHKLSYCVGEVSPFGQSSFFKTIGVQAAIHFHPRFGSYICKNESVFDGSQFGQSGLLSKRAISHPE